ncbi:polyprenyl synthetase family protein [Actinokineospora globicatena]|uniref:polyprenyl synthetase family protein n=1 Tax=Actinokineospora globicatena TaxID=103729 RepID=UPI0020A596E3|nr:polyprenyl synthetase family protein [Actinokineospora globicatena]MCP2300575.1 geranylgeranyl diphosphate synthase, type I [Actinokineospora globicatena]GLW81120.1 dimethylallyltransferase [Actinokineospora globicatena]GLW88313.1 dimethylallyltransferase [Actinokineospora globicatena]
MGPGTEQLLATSRAAVLPALRAAVDSLPPAMRRIACYHFGWVDACGAPIEADSGKMVRSALTLLSAEAVGGDPADAVPAAVAIELVHNFSLLHDDIMDGDRTRRHRGTAWAVFGVPAALLAGDALWALALRVLAAGPHADRALPLLTEALWRLMDGQSADADFPHRHSVTLAECEAMAAGKTGAVMACATALGALFGGATPDQLALLRDMGEHLGLAFQLVDDLLGIWGDPTTTGKPGADLVHRKRSLPVVAALTSNTPAGAELATLYLATDHPMTTPEQTRAATLITTAGGRTWATTQAELHLAQATTALRRTNPPAPALANLLALADHFAHRTS